VQAPMKKRARNRGMNLPIGDDFGWCINIPHSLGNQVAAPEFASFRSSPAKLGPPWLRQTGMGGMVAQELAKKQFHLGSSGGPRSPEIN
jgi:hypothetical protein